MERSKRDGRSTEWLLVITGSMGAGKTAVLGEASDILSVRQIVHAAIDLDALGLARLPTGAVTDAVMYENLRSIRRNYAALGVQRFLLARAIEDDAQLNLCRGIFAAANTVVCRLIARTETTMRRRIESREAGISRQEYVTRVSELDVILDRSRLEDFSVSNKNRPLTDVALEMLVKAGWIPN